MRVYISEQEKFSDFNSEGVFIWHETNIPYAVWGPQGTRSFPLKHYLSEALKHNASKLYEKFLKMNFIARTYHRGASIVSTHENGAPVTCQEGFDKWYNRQAPNPNVLEGAIVSGPDQGNNYGDSRIERISGLRGRVIAMDLSPVAVTADSFNVQSPPYILSDHISGLQPEVGWHEPRLALDAGVDGIDVLLHLCNGGRVVADHFFEIESGNIGKYIVMSNLYAADAR
ncbi:hypothetical protein AAG906_010527 [Vitis piasezkii]